LTLGSLPLFAASLLVEQGAATAWSLEFFGLLAFLSVAATAFVTAAWYWLIQGQAVGRLSLVLFLVPAFGLGLAVWFLGETATAAQLGGLTLIVGGLLSVRR
jgi:drug/metabolite transporter (DMT)-like permease